MGPQGSRLGYETGLGHVRELYYYSYTNIIRPPSASYVHTQSAVLYSEQKLNTYHSDTGHK